MSLNKLETLLISDKDGSRGSLIILMLRDKKKKKKSEKHKLGWDVPFYDTSYGAKLSRLFKFKITSAVMQTKFAISEKSDRKKANRRKFKEI